VVFFQPFDAFLKRGDGGFVLPCSVELLTGGSSRTNTRSDIGSRLPFRVKAHTYAQTSRRRFNIVRVLVLDNPPCPTSLQLRHDIFLFVVSLLPPSPSGITWSTVAVFRLLVLLPDSHTTTLLYGLVDNALATSCYAFQYSELGSM
jgi:hypothetical protein